MSSATKDYLLRYRIDGVEGERCVCGRDLQQAAMRVKAQLTGELRVPAERIEIISAVIPIRAAPDPLDVPGVSGETKAAHPLAARARVALSPEAPLSHAQVLALLEELERAHEALQLQQHGWAAAAQELQAYRKTIREARAQLQGELEMLARLNERIAQWECAARRYELVRTLSVPEFRTLWLLNARTGEPFDTLVDRLAEQRAAHPARPPASPQD